MEKQNSKEAKCIYDQSKIVADETVPSGIILTVNSEQARTLLFIIFFSFVIH